MYRNRRPEFKAIEISTNVISAYLSNNPLPASELPRLIVGVHAVIAGLRGSVDMSAAKSDEEKATPAQIRKSITPDALISFIDGKPYKMLKRHLGSRGFSVATYRARFGLPSDYPTVAPNYSAARAALAKIPPLGRQSDTMSRPAVAGAAAEKTIV